MYVCMVTGGEHVYKPQMCPSRVLLLTSHISFLLQEKFISSSRRMII